MSAVRTDLGGDIDGPAFAVSPDLARTSALRLLWLLPLAVVVASLAAMLGAVAGIWLASLLPDGLPFGAAYKLLQAQASQPRPLSGRLLEFSLTGVASFAAALAALGIVAWAYRRPVRAFLTSSPGLRWRTFALGFVISAPVVVAAVAAERLLEPQGGTPPLLGPDPLAQKLIYAAGAAVFLFLAAAAEEMLFRGWLLQEMASRLRRTLVVLAVNGVLFALVHFDPDPGAFAVRAIMGAAWAWLAIRSGGIEFTTGAHLANNLAVALLIAPITFQAPDRREVDLGAILIQLLVVGIIVAIYEALRARRRRGG